MKKTIKSIDSIANLFDDNPTDELPVLNEAAIARIESAEARSADNPEEDTGEHPALRPEPVTETNRDWSMADESPALERLELELKGLQQRWHHIENELRERDTHVNEAEASLRARSRAIEALEEDLQVARRARLELEQAADSMRAEQAEQLQRIDAQQSELEARNEELGALRAELDQTRSQIAELTAELAEWQAQNEVAEARTKHVAAHEQALVECRTRIQDLENHLEGRRTRWNALQATSEHQTRLLATLEQAARAKEKQLLRQDRETRRMVDQLGMLERRALESRQHAAALGKENQALCTELGTRDAQLSTLSETLAANRADGDSLVASIDDKAAQVEDLQQQLKGMAGELKIARRNLRAAETHAVAQEESISDERARAVVLTGQVETLEEELAAARDALSEKGRRLTDIDASAAELAASLLAADDELKELRDNRHRMETELEARDEEIRRLDAEVTELQEQHAATDVKLARQQATISDLEAELQDKAQSLNKMAHDLGRIGDLEARIMELDGLMSQSLDAEDGSEERAPGITRVMVSISDERTVKYPLFKTNMVIGRSADSDIQIRRQYISRRHARLCTEQGETYIEDLGSKNGVLVNASRITRHRLRNGDLVNLGKMQFKFIDLLTHAASKRSA